MRARRLDTTGVVFLITILTGSFLLFLVQPMIARMAMPRLGGAPAVWNSAMLVYQTLLLAGYAYAHGVARLAPRRQVAIHLLVLLAAALWLPIGLSDMHPSTKAEPALWVLWLFIMSIGPLFFAVAAQAPLMQRWFSLSSGGREPYALYAASNLGSFGGLIAYPLIVEPLMPLSQQSWLWSAGYVLLFLLVIGCALLVLRAAPGASADATVKPGAPTGWRRLLHWMLLAAVPSGLMLSSTTHLTTDIVAVPLLWVVPLGLYLLSFSVAFAAVRWPADAITRAAPLAILVLGGLSLTAQHIMPFTIAAIILLLLFIASVALHTTLYRLRPAADRLTGFYLAMAAGGALGGLFGALFAPVAFDWTYEHPLLILGAAILVPKRHLTRGIRRLWAGGQRTRIGTVIIALIALGTVLLSSEGVFPRVEHVIDPAALIILTIAGIVALGRHIAFSIVVAAMLLVQGVWGAIEISFKGDQRSRSYFGTYTVNDDNVSGVRMLSHGTTLHGMQFITDGRERLATSYYTPHSGVGIAMRAVEQLYGPAAQIGVVGLGTGTLGCYAKPGQGWRFYEIDPEMARIARDTGQFSYLKRCTPDAEILIGDARISLAEAPAGGIDVLVLDAFSSDTIPVHLLTREAFRIYGRALAPDGLLLVHISNRYMDLQPVMAGVARANGWDAMGYFYQPDARARTELGANSAYWIVLSRDIDAMSTLIDFEKADWHQLREQPGFVPWSDDYASILPLLRGSLFGN